MAWNRERFDSKVERERGRDGCERWTGAHTANGYAVLYVDGVQHRAHRVAWEMAKGPISRGRKLWACERNRDCVRVDHLRLVADEKPALRPASDRARQGRGHMRQRGADTFQLIVYVGIDAATGKEQYHRETLHGIAKAARRRLDAIVKEVDEGRHRNPDVTVADLLRRWLAHAGPDLSPSTLRSYKGYIDKRIEPALGRLPLEKLTTATLDDFYASLRAELSPASVRQIHAIIRRACHVGEKWGLLARNPAALATPPRPNPTERKPPTAKAARAFITKLVDLDPDLAVFVRLAAISGARRGELVALRWDDLNLDTAELTIARAAVDTGKVTIKSTKGGRVRRLRLDPVTIDVLRAHRAREEEKANYFEVAFSTTAPIFTVEPGKPWRPDYAGSRFKIAADECKVTFTMHALRHFAATELIGAGVNIRTVSGRLGHAQTSTTLNVYAAEIASADEAAAATLASVLDG
jgi:integrase